MINKIVAIIVSSVSLFSYEIANSEIKPLAFPSAEGEGKYTVGGRGGKVLFVTNLNASGAGSLRDACMANFPRTILFRTGGTIDLGGENIIIKNNNITIAGQSAPGDGIQIKNGGISIQASEVIIRYLRIRPGATPNNVDALNVKSPNRHIRKKNIMIDHVSAFWGEDETLNGGSFSDNVTVQWSIIAEGLNCSTYTNQGREESWIPCKEDNGKSIWAHSRGSMITSDSRNITFHHNLLYRNYKRNPLIQSSDANVINNVMINHQYQTFVEPFSAPVHVNFIGNYFRSYVHKRPPIRVYNFNTGYDADSSIYYKDNYDKVFRANESQPETDIRIIHTKNTFKNAIQERITPYQFTAINIEPVHVAYNSVLENVGANYPKRDSTDERVINFVKSEKAPRTLVNNPEEVGGWPILEKGKALEDTDNDGIPNQWEESHGLDSQDYQDAQSKTNEGYTNLEIYLNSLLNTKSNENNECTKILKFISPNGLKFNPNEIKSLEIKNEGTCDLNINKINFHERIKKSFSVIGLTLPTTIAPNNTLNINIQYNPSNEQSLKQGLIYISSDKTNHSDRSRLLIGE